MGLRLYHGATALPGALHLGQQERLLTYVLTERCSDLAEGSPGQR